MLYRKRKKRIFLFGFSYWKRNFIKPFFAEEGEIVFCRTLDEALGKGLTKHSSVYLWGKNPFPEVEAYIGGGEGKLWRVEDGFIRSVSLGSDLTRPYSLVMDSRGIYFDPHEESDLEHMLNTATFGPELIVRAQRLQDYLVRHRISKYNADRERKLILPHYSNEKKVILIPGQVEDDASILYGANGMSNLALIKETRKHAPEAYIVYKPHPDVLAGNRKGNVAYDDVMKYCDMMIANTSLDSILALSDEVHTMTSLVGFEALIRGKKVYTYGTPFYAGWGLTFDRKTVPRRTRRRTLDELVAATLIVYPRYINPVDSKPCEIEVILNKIDEEKKRYNKNSLYKVYVDSRNIVSRKIQWCIKALKGE
ncbi:hypothetical protein YH65_01500 [Sulfurovum lithotrophicum]|uniref:Capsule biosynthesis protein n=1 Tax=Sulfurovum lithotrophicum TaxID=206403 RepID=A0A7U4RRL8_9BACT|nr:hypothetical protein YH65_01500 [Sulfurovum lithotrophicum]